RLMAGRTVVMVAHRMRTVQRADHVLFLDGGRVAEGGTHDALLRHDGRYAAFWDISMTPVAGD
ncbi:ABC transporter ATP-binding protein, partial [Actinomadura adrarensis]